MTLDNRFTDALKSAVESSGELTPSSIAGAAATALQIDGAGIALTDRLLRLPLGASNPDVTTAEQIQTTLGDGPCIEAARSQIFQTADATELAARWPLYYADLYRRTPFRSVAAIPLREPGGVFAAMNLYSRQVSMDSLPPVNRIGRDIGDSVAALLLGLVDDLGELEDGVTARVQQTLGSGEAPHHLHRRLEVWTAVGMLMEAASVDDRDALAILRSYAFSRSLTVDIVSASLVHHRLAADDILNRC